MEEQKHPPEKRQLWKKRMGVEFSGLERPRQFLGAILGAAVFVAIALIIAWISFG